MRSEPHSRPIRIHMSGSDQSLTVLTVDSEMTEMTRTFRRTGATPRAQRYHGARHAEANNGRGHGRPQRPAGKCERRPAARGAPPRGPGASCAGLAATDRFRLVDWVQLAESLLAARRSSPTLLAAAAARRPAACSRSSPTRCCGPRHQLASHKTAPRAVAVQRQRRAGGAQPARAAGAHRPAAGAGAGAAGRLRHDRGEEARAEREHDEDGGEPAGHRVRGACTTPSHTLRADAANCSAWTQAAAAAIRHANPSGAPAGPGLIGNPAGPPRARGGAPKPPCPASALPVRHCVSGSSAFVCACV